MHKLLLVLLTVALVSIPAHAVQTFTFPEKDPFFSISFPQSWNQKDKDNTGFIEMATPDDAIWIDVWVLEKSKSPDDTNTIGDIEDDMKSWLTNIDIKRDPSADFTVNGVKFAAVTGTGKDKDGDVQVIECDICSPDGKNLVAVCYYGDKGADTKYKDDLETVYRSIKAL